MAHLSGEKPASSLQELEEATFPGEGGFESYGAPKRAKRFWRWKLFAIAGAISLALAYLRRPHADKEPATPAEDRSSWSFDFHPSYSKPKALKPCDWTFTLEFGAMHWGLGSTLFIQLMGIDWALQQGRTILFDRVEGIYGSYQDFFQPREQTLPCIADEDLFDVNSTRVCADKSCVNPNGFDFGPVRKNHTAYVGGKYVGWARERALAQFANEDDLMSPDFPVMDSQKPLPASLTLPDAFVEGYRRIRSIWEAYFQPSESMKALIAERVQRLKPVRERGPVVVVHWRAGDKVKDECKPSARMTCGNVTLHAEAAWDAYVDLGLPGSGKPTLAIITAEHDAVDLFKADPIGGRFGEVLGISTPSPLNSYDQWKFNDLPLEARRADMQNFLADYWYAIEHADAFVVSGNSNMGRIALTIAGEEKLRSGRVRSVDAYWHPGVFMISPPTCMGRHYCYA